MFIKPHANNHTTQEFVRNYLKQKNFIISLEGDFDCEYISNSACVDKQYASMAKKSLESPSKLDLTEEIMEDFEKNFGMSWEAALNSEMVFGVAESAERLEISDTELSGLWLEIVINNPTKSMKLQRSVNCCLIDCIDGKSPFFCINGFFMGMRSEYTNAPNGVHYFLVEWWSTMLNWEEFRCKVIGSTDPYEAHDESLRSIIASKWLDLMLRHPLNIMNNAIHASSSAFESCVERSIWFKTPIEKDAMFGQKMLSAGVPLITLREWSHNPKLFDKCIFDHMVNMDSAHCISKARVLLARSMPGTVHFVVTPIMIE